MATRWRDYGRTDSHGMCLETPLGFAEIDTTRTDHQFLVTLCRPSADPRTRLFATLETAQAWVEQQLR